MRTALAALLLVTAGCGSSTAERPGGAGTVTVLAAASLNEAFSALGEQFEADHPGLEIAFSFGASSALARQALEGAPADLLVTADEVTMATAVDGGAASDPRVVARNRLSILVAPGNPEGIASLADLARPGLVVVLCGPEVPCGRFAAQALRRAGVSLTPRSLEENVKGVVSKVTLGEADAGIVYVTDARAAGGRAQGVDIPEADNVIAIYPMALLDQAGEPEAARAFRDFVLSRPGQEMLARHGFLPA